MTAPHLDALPFVAPYLSKEDVLQVGLALSRACGARIFPELLLAGGQRLRLELWSEAVARLGSHSLQKELSLVHACVEVADGGGVTEELGCNVDPVTALLAQ